jgi:hypothetical protein
VPTVNAVINLNVMLNVPVEREMFYVTRNRHDCRRRQLHLLSRAELLAPLCPQKANSSARGSHTSASCPVTF